MGAPAVVVRHDGFVRRDRLWRGAGLALPVFAARTRQSVGGGEFLDLMALVDLADAAGMRLLQVSEACWCCSGCEGYGCTLDASSIQKECIEGASSIQKE